MSDIDFQNGFLCGLSTRGLGIGDDQRRLAIIQDILYIGQSISLDASWAEIDTLIRSWYISGPMIKILDTFALSGLTIISDILIMEDTNDSLQDVTDNISIGTIFSDNVSIVVT